MAIITMIAEVEVEAETAAFLTPWDINSRQ